MDIYCRKIIKQMTHVMIYWQDRFLMHYIILPLRYRLKLLFEYEWLGLHCYKNKITNEYKLAPYTRTQGEWLCHEMSMMT